jgi:hypothetical protein
MGLKTELEKAEERERNVRSNPGGRQLSVFSSSEFQVDKREIRISLQILRESAGSCVTMSNPAEAYRDCLPHLPIQANGMSISSFTGSLDVTSHLFSLNLASMRSLCRRMIGTQAANAARVLAVGQT